MKGQRPSLTPQTSQQVQNGAEVIETYSTSPTSRSCPVTSAHVEYRRIYCTKGELVLLRLALARLPLAPVLPPQALVPLPLPLVLLPLTLVLLLASTVH